MKKYILDTGHHRKAIPEKGKCKVRTTFTLIIVLREFPGFNLEGVESKWSSALVSLSVGHRPRQPESAQQKAGERAVQRAHPRDLRVHPSNI